jgi:hypothetical protein
MALSLFLLTGCASSPKQDVLALPPRSSPGPIRLIEVAASKGITFRHSCGSRSPLGIVETLGGGCAFLDIDGDGLLDIFLVSSGDDFTKPRQSSGSRLYRNTGKGVFVDETADSGIVVDGYAMGCCAGDYDNDGNVDLFVTGFGRNWLFHGLGHGKFKDVTVEAGILRRPGAWGMGCAFVDVNRDGLLDLYVANYVRYDQKIPFCETGGVKHGCTPNQYPTQANELYINKGGKFVEQAVELGAENRTGAGLGVVTCDFDNDGWPDIFVANDGTPNALLHNQKGHFTDVGQSSGVAYSEDGVMRAGMPPTSTATDSSI